MAGSGSTDAVQSTALEYAPYIILLPMLAFPVILFLGKMFNGNKMWKENLKEGGLIALPVMGASLLLSLWLITDFIGGNGHGDTTGWTWFTSGMWDSGQTTVTEISLGFGIYIDQLKWMQPYPF